MFWTWLFRVQAPGTEKSATFLPMKLSAVLTCSGPFSVTFTKVASGSLSPVWIVMVGILSLEGILVAPTSGAPVAKSRMRGREGHLGGRLEIGRASGREGVWQYV